jgi:Na+-translocating ferredoxin:NAD+ oxidoreductase RnfG subunit
VKGYLVAFAGIFLTTSVVYANLLNREDALKAAFPGAQIESSIIFLTDQEKRNASQFSGQTVESALVARFTASQNGKEVGRAYVDTHIVRTKKETLLIILDAEGKLKRVEVIAFLEPPEYLPTERWYEQFEEKSLDENLRMKRNILPVAGATLTARATIDAVRRVLAIDEVLSQRREEKP